MPWMFRASPDELGPASRFRFQVFRTARGGFGLWESGSGFGLYGWWLGLEAWGVLLFMNYWCPAPWLVFTRCGLSFDCSAWEFSCIGIGRRGHGCFCVGTVSGQLFVISSANGLDPSQIFKACRLTLWTKHQQDFLTPH